MRQKIKSMGFVLVCVFTVATCAQEASNSPDPGSQWQVPSNANIKAMLVERMRHNGVGVVVGIVDKNGRRVVVNGVSGAANGRELDGDTVFQLGSLTKLFTTLLLADMVHRNQVALADLAVNYMPANIELSAPGGSITLKHLATHTSGLPSMPENFDIRGIPSPFEAYTIEQMYAFLSTYAFNNAPGEKRSYSNLGVSLLGILLANRAGKEYEDLLTERVLRPLDMTSTSINLNSSQRQRLAPGHDPYLKPVNTWEMKTLSASGSLRSTANDMLNFLEAYLGRRNSELDPAIQIQVNERNTVGGSEMALGWFITPEGIFRHSGGKEGYRSGIAINFNLGIGVIVLANARTTDLPGDLALHLATGQPLAPALPAPPDKPRIALNDKVLDSYAGKYQFPNGQLMQVVRNQSLLLARYPDGSILPFVATKPNAFFYNAGNDDIEFAIGENGAVESLTLYPDGKHSDTHYIAQKIRD